MQNILNDILNEWGVTIDEVTLSTDEFKDIASHVKYYIVSYKDKKDIYMRYGFTHIQLGRVVSENN